MRLCDAWVDIADDPRRSRRAAHRCRRPGVLFRRRPRHGDPAHDANARSRKANGRSGFAADRKQLGAAILRNATFFKPIVAAINGHAHAGGAEFLLSTDIRIMSSEATIAVTEVRRGLIAGGGSLARLARQIPWAHAMELILVGEPISAQQALAIGLVNRVVPPDRGVADRGRFRAQA